MIPLVYCHIKSFQRASSVEKPLLGGEKRIDIITAQKTGQRSYWIPGSWHLRMVYT
jgi:hypothetical protein